MSDEKIIRGRTFRDELAVLINEYNLENGSDTADYILAEYLLDCLKAFDRAINRRSGHAIHTTNNKMGD